MMKKFIFKTILLSLPFLLVLVFVNYFGDAARLFANDYEKKMARILGSGHYVTNFGNYDERLCQLEFIKLQTVQPKTVIVGSSRTMLINSNNFLNRETVFNNSVSGASIEDLICIYQIYKENKKLPSKIILGIDPWTFNDLSDQTRWLSIDHFYYRFLNQPYKGSSQSFKYKELFSISYFQSSVKLIPRFLKGNLDPQPSISTNNISATKLTDGGLIYDKKFREASQKEIDDKIATYIADDLYSIENYKEISPKCWLLFEKLINEIRHNKIEVEIFLAPYAPLVYNKIEKEYPLVIKTESLIKNFAKSKTIKVFGSYNPYELGMDKTFFYDGMHMKEKGIKKIFELVSP